MTLEVRAVILAVLTVKHGGVGRQPACEFNLKSATQGTKVGSQQRAFLLAEKSEPITLLHIRWRTCDIHCSHVCVNCVNISK